MTNIKNIEEKNPNDYDLLSAIQEEDLNLVKEILAKDVNINIKDDYGVTPIMRAAQLNNLRIVKLLMKKGADIKMKSDGGSTALDFASHSGALDIVKLLLEKGGDIDNDKKGLTEFIIACENNQLDKVKEFIENGINVDMQKSNGHTALMGASSNGHVDVIKVLIANGAKFNIDKNSWSEVMIATECGHLDAVKELIAAGANINEHPDGEVTALMLATMTFNLDIVKELLANGADVTIKSCKGDDALSFALKDSISDIANELIAYGAINKDDKIIFHKFSKAGFDLKDKFIVEGVNNIKKILKHYDGKNNIYFADHEFGDDYLNGELVIGYKENDEASYQTYLKSKGFEIAGEKESFEQSENSGATLMFWLNQSEKDLNKSICEINVPNSLCESLDGDKDIYELNLSSNPKPIKRFLFSKIKELIKSDYEYNYIFVSKTKSKLKGYKGSSNKRYRENLKKYIPTNDDYIYFEKYFRIVNSEKFLEEFGKLVIKSVIKYPLISELLIKFNIEANCLEGLSYKSSTIIEHDFIFWIGYRKFDRYMYNQRWYPGPRVVDSTDKMADFIYSKPSFAYFENLFEMYESKSNEELQLMQENNVNEKIEKV